MLPLATILVLQACPSYPKNKTKFHFGAIKTIHLNTRSIKKHHGEMVVPVCFLESLSPVIGLSETWLTNDDHPFLYSIPGYFEIFSKCRFGRGGGVMIQDGQHLIVVKTIPGELDEYVSVELKYKNVRLQVWLVYNPPTGNKQDFLDRLDSFVSSFQSASMPVIACDDINIDVIRKTQLVEHYLNVHASIRSFERSEPSM